MHDPTLGSVLFGRWFYATSDGVSVLESDGTIACSNSVFASWLGAAVDELERTSLQRWLTEPQVVGAILADGGLEQVVFQRRDGARVPLRLRSTTMTHDQRRLVGVVVQPASRGRARAALPSELRDVQVDTGELVEELCATQATLEERNREIAVLAGQLSRFGWRAAVGELVAGIAHHLNNPVGALASTLRRIDHKVGVLADSSARDELATLVQRCRDISRRIESNVSAVVRTHNAANAEASRQWLVLPDEIETALAMFADRLHQVVVVRDYEDHQAVLAPHDSLHLVLANIFDNSLYAMSGLGVLTLTIRQRGERVVLRIADNGCGVPPDILPHLFEPILTARQGGAGLGLSTAQRLARAWGGQLSHVPSSTGAIFEISIPTRGAAERGHASSAAALAELSLSEVAPGHGSPAPSLAELSLSEVAPGHASPAPALAEFARPEAAPGPKEKHS